MAAVVPPGVPLTWSEAWSAPTEPPTFGAEWALTVQLAPAANVWPVHPSVPSANWSPLVPPSWTASAPVATPPPLVSTKGESAPTAPCTTEPSAWLVGLMPIAAGARPCPGR